MASVVFTELQGSEGYDSYRGEHIPKREVPPVSARVSCDIVWAVYMLRIPNVGHDTPANIDGKLASSRGLKCVVFAG